MKKIRDEMVSAYLDDEVSPFERYQGTRDLCEDDEARRRLGRYQLIGDAMRSDLPPHLETGFASQMRQVIQREVMRTHTPPHWSLKGILYWILHPGPRVAFSAVAAVVLMLGLWGYVDRATQEDAPMTAYNTTIVEPEAVQNRAEIIQQQRVMQSYLATHAEYAASQVMIPYLQLVDYEE